MNFSKFIAYTKSAMLLNRSKEKGADAVTNLNTYYKKHGLRKISCTFIVEIVKPLSNIWTVKNLHCSFRSAVF